MVDFFQNHVIIHNITHMEVKQMAYVISDQCISCGACEADCPVSAISQGDDRYVIDPATCIDCGACEATCPVGAPHAE